MNTPYAAFFDIDGTLAANNQPPLAADVDAIRAFRAAGNYVFICTGRSRGYLYSAITDIGFDGIICGAGAHVMLGDKVIHRACVTPAQLDPILHRFEDADETLIMETERTMVQLACDHAHRLIPRYPRIRTAAEWYAQYADETVSKITVYGHPISDDLKALVTKDLWLIEHSTYYEACPLGNSKSSGIQHIIGKLGIPRERVLAFGDSANDSDMIAFAGIGVAMGNALEEVKAIADFVTLPFSEAGIAHALNTLSLQ